MGLTKNPDSLEVGFVSKSPDHDHNTCAGPVLTASGRTKVLVSQNDRRHHHQSRLKWDWCPKTLSTNVNSLVSFTPLQFFFFRLFKEKGVLNPRRDVNLIVDSRCKNNESYDSIIEGITPSISSQGAVRVARSESDVESTGLFQREDDTLDFLAEESNASLLSVVLTESSVSSEHDTIWQGSCRSIDVFVKEDVTTFQSPTYKSPTSVMDMFGEGGIPNSCKDPNNLHALMVQYPQPSISKKPFDKGENDNDTNEGERESRCCSRR